jgi:hypothetical protein
MQPTIVSRANFSSSAGFDGFAKETASAGPTITLRKTMCSRRHSADTALAVLAAIGGTHEVSVERIVVVAPTESHCSRELASVLKSAGGL